MHAQSNSQDDDDDFEEQEAEVNRTLFVNGLPESTTEDELFELFLQAGPLEKVAIPQNKNMAFITYKHSVSAPYAKEVFCDTKLHGRMLNVNFRTGSVHIAGNRRQSTRQEGYNGNRDARNSNSGSHQNSSYPIQPNQNFYNSPVQQNGPFSPPIMNYVRPNNPFSPNMQSMPQFAIQGYRSSVDNREYVPQYVSFESPPASFRGGVPINHSDHPVRLDERRDRLLGQNRYANQTNNMPYNQGRYSGHRR